MHTKQAFFQPLSQCALTVVLFFSASCSWAQDSAVAQVDNPSIASSVSTATTDTPAVGFDPSSARAWMRRLANTINESSFDISFVASESGRETLPYVWRHAVLDDGTEAEQLSLLNGPGFERIRINEKMSVFEPGFTPYSVRARQIDNPIPAAFLHYPDSLHNAYDVLLMGRNRVLGRMAQQLRVLSKDKTRFGYFLWLDEQTGLLLKMNMYSVDNRLLKQIQVTQLTVNDEVQRYFANIQQNQLPPISVPSVEQEAEFLWTVGYLPVGMEKVKQKLHRLSATGQPTEYMMLSDGLVDVSVYVMTANQAITEDLSITTDATSVVSISNGRIQVTVVGEVPSSTATAIANSIILVDKQP